MRNGNSKVFQKEIDLLSEAIQGSPIPNDATVYRAMNLEKFMSKFNITNPEELSGLIGMHYTDEGFTSTTVMDWAYNVELEDNYFKDMDVQMTISLPEGTPGLYIQSIGRHEYEYELLLDKGIDAIIRDVYEEDGKWFINMIVK